MENDKEPRLGYLAAIPASVRYDDSIPASSKVLFAEISALTEKEGYCWASNEYFARVFKLTEKSVRQQLRALADAGYIRIEEDRGNHKVLTARRIYPNFNPVPKGKAASPLNEKVQPLEEKVQRHIIKENNIPPISPQHFSALKRLDGEIAGAVADAAGDNAALLEAWIDFLEMRRGKHAPVKTVRTVQLLQKKLAAFSGGSPERAAAVLLQSVEKSWTGLFALKDDAAAVSPSENGGYWADDPDN